MRERRPPGRPRKYPAPAPRPGPAPSDDVSLAVAAPAAPGELDAIVAGLGYRPSAVPVPSPG